jgi:arsenite transporter
MANEISKGLDFLSRFLTAWIFAAMLIGIGYFAPGITQFILSLQVGTTSSIRRMANNMSISSTEKL